jgi:hypothetical protein
MSNQADYEAWLEGISDFHTAFDDAWSRLFAMILGVRTPDKKVKEKFRQFISNWCMETTGQLSASEQDMIELLPDFLEALVDDNE